MVMKEITNHQKSNTFMVLGLGGPRCRTSRHLPLFSFSGGVLGHSFLWKRCSLLSGFFVGGASGGHFGNMGVAG